ncbi:hypothetical protein KSB_79690 [Ktedonobacter robiniae]|uniref:Uncharacterized protein n=1 Tax=Ktedonobacter robiniae TaxID=2778365 RepID=A0ABQ3V2V2_9CHLR|nr:hypothetical protein KSB_79690 [Ktedonobacter robiniae]
MSLALRKNQMFALFLLAILTLIVVGLVAFSTIAHINLWHAFTSLDFKPNVVYPHS